VLCYLYGCGGGGGGGGGLIGRSGVECSVYIYIYIYSHVFWGGFEEVVLRGVEGSRALYGVVWYDVA
jgi:hypothetical protein